MKLITTLLTLASLALTAFASEYASTPQAIPRASDLVAFYNGLPPATGKLPSPLTFPMVCMPRRSNLPAINFDFLGQTLITADIFELHLNGNSLALLYQKFTGHHVNLTARAAAAEFRLLAEASPQHPVTYAEAAELIKIAAMIDNFSFVIDDEDPNLEILKNSPRHIIECGGVDVFNETSRLPD